MPRGNLNRLRGTKGRSGRRAKGECLGLEEEVVPELGGAGWQGQHGLGEVQSPVRGWLVPQSSDKLLNIGSIR